MQGAGRGTLKLTPRSVRRLRPPISFIIIKYKWRYANQVFDIHGSAISVPRGYPEPLVVSHYGTYLAEPELRAIVHNC